MKKASKVYFFNKFVLFNRFGQLFFKKQILNKKNKKFFKFLLEGL